jgi:hypothetical protein
MAGTPDSQIQRVPSSNKRPEDDELKPFVIVGDLGKGSFATVYKGYNEVRRDLSCYLTTQPFASANATRGSNKDGQPRQPLNQAFREPSKRNRYSQVTISSSHYKAH